jgi:hypothetical protein
MKSQTKFLRLHRFVIPLTVLLMASLVSMGALAKDKKLPEVSSDGLHLVKDAKVRVAYAKPGVSLEKYTKVKILDCYVQFKKDYMRDYNMDEVGLSGRVSTKDMDDIKKRLAAEFNKVFTDELTKAGHQVVTEVGPDTLLLRPAIINLDVTAPDLLTANMGNTWVASAGQMTLYLEMYDSASSELLARVIDPEAGNQGGMAQISNRVTNKVQADQIIRRWAKLLSGHLGDIEQNSK